MKQFFKNFHLFELKSVDGYSENHHSTWEDRGAETQRTITNRSTLARVLGTGRVYRSIHMKIQTIYLLSKLDFF